MSSVSYGLALCRLNNGVPEVVMVKKRSTYHFSEFVLGRYKVNDNRYLGIMFNNMTHNEKMDILSMNFDLIWYRMWLESPNIENTNGIGKEISPKFRRYYTSNKLKFEKLISDNGKRLKYLINKSENTETIWEVPKGKKEMFEKDINTAIREFTEETNINYDRYNILWHVKPITISFTECGVVYTYIYYLAEDCYEKKWDPKISFDCYSQLKEVENIKWISLKDVEFLQLNNKLKRRTIGLLTTIFTTYKKNINITCDKLLPITH